MFHMLPNLCSFGERCTHPGEVSLRTALNCADTLLCNLRIRHITATAAVTADILETTGPIPAHTGMITGLSMDEHVCLGAPHPGIEFLGQYIPQGSVAVQIPFDGDIQSCFVLSAVPLSCDPERYDPAIADDRAVHPDVRPHATRQVLLDEAELVMQLVHSSDERVPSLEAVGRFVPPGESIFFPFTPIWLLAASCRLLAPHEYYASIAQQLKLVDEALRRPATPETLRTLEVIRSSYEELAADNID